MRGFGGTAVKPLLQFGNEHPAAAGPAADLPYRFDRSSSRNRRAGLKRSAATGTHHQLARPTQARTKPLLLVFGKIRPAPTLLTTAPIALANDCQHDIDRPAFDAGTSFGTAGGEGGHFFYFPT